MTIEYLKDNNQTNSHYLTKATLGFNQRRVQQQNKFIMQSQRAIFTLKGTNINLPTRYKIRKYKPGRAKSDQQQKPEEPLQDQLPFIIQAKQSFPKKAKIDFDRRNLKISQEHSTPLEDINHHTMKLNKNDTQHISSSNAKIKHQRPPLTIFKKGREHFSSMKTKRCACGDCSECLKDFDYFLQLFSDDHSVPEISAKSWCIWKKKNGRFAYYYGKRIHKVREIASLTKIITAMTASDFLIKHNWEPEKISYQIKKTSLMVGGTTANLIQGQIYTLQDLFYGMMLPSGNDAAIAISEVIGLLAFLKSKNKLINPYQNDWFRPYLNKNYSYIFIGMMNEKCQKIGTLDTKFFNSHGNDSYDQLKNISTCNQIAKLSSQFTNYPKLKEIVKTSTYGPFQNTNKLLEDGFDGIKTGITDTAGPCLAASYKDLIIVVLNSKSMNQRWIQVKKLVKWIIKKG